MWRHRVPQGAFARLERHAGKLARAVLRGLGGSNSARLPGRREQSRLLSRPVCRVVHFYVAAVVKPLSDFFPSCSGDGVPSSRAVWWLWLTRSSASPMSFHPCAHVQGGVVRGSEFCPVVTL